MTDNDPAEKSDQTKKAESEAAQASDQPAGTKRSKEPKPPFWNRLPRYIKGTRIRSSTAILSVLFILLLVWYLNLRTEFVPEEQRRTGQTVVQNDDTTPPSAPSSVAPSRPSMPSSGVPSSGASSSDEDSSSSTPSGLPGQPSEGSESPGAPTNGQTTSPSGPGAGEPRQPGGGGTTEPGADGAPTTTAAPS